jgi:pimeloyl-ACP methyl ester carboxylesterase
MSAPTGPPSIEDATSRYADAGGLRVHYVEAGSGAPVLLLHGWPQHHYMWREVIGRLRDRFRLIAPDLRGFGWSEAPGAGYDGDTFARDQVALLDALGIERAHVVGHDWGGWTSMLLGLGHPERIGRIVACNTPHPWPRVRPRMALSAWRSWYAVANALPLLGPALHRRTGWVAAVLRRASADGTFTPQELEIYARSFRDPARAAAATSLYRYYQRAIRLGLTGHWRGQRLEPPTLLLFGQRDAYIPAALLDSGFEGHGELQVELVPDCGHFIVDERPELVADRAAEFLSSERRR